MRQAISSKCHSLEPEMPTELHMLCNTIANLSVQTAAFKLTSDAEHDQNCGRVIRDVLTESAGRCLLRTDYPAHLTGSLCLLSGDCTHILLTHHRKLGKWLQLGGHLNPGELPQNAALREGEEESGLKRADMLGTVLLDLDIHPIPPIGLEPGHLHLDLCYASVIAGSSVLPKVVPSAESHDLRWVRLDQLPLYTTEESLERKCRKLKRLIEAGQLSCKPR
jgi:8-oxo-dGTP pyrophosphatase MutT (NUDIX family)